MQKLRSALFSVSTLFAPAQIMARVATSSLFPNTRIINPAAISNRDYSGYSVQATKKDIEATLITEDSTFGDLSWKSETSVEGVDINTFARLKKLNIEFYGSPQRGSKVINNSTEGYSSSSTENELETIGMHFLASYSLGKYLTLGIKRTLASSKFTLKNEQAYTGYEYSNTSENDISITTTGYGVTLKLLNKKLHIGAGVETINYQNSYSEQYDVNYTDTPSDNTSSTSSDEDDLTIKKTFYGIAYFSGNIKSHGIKLEWSVEKMPPLFETIVDTKDGEASLYTAEINTKLFVGGVTFKRIRGYYIDTYDLVPFFLNIENIGNSFRDELELNFTLKLAKKGSFGATVLFSEEDSYERLDSYYSDLYPVNKKTNTYGLSYTYIF